MMGIDISQNGGGKMRRILLVSSISFLVFIAFIATAGAVGITNGSFESGFFSWQTLNYTSIKNAGFGVIPNDGLKDALIEAVSGDTLNASDVTSFLGVSNATLQSIKSGFTDFTEGSAIKQSFSANVGDVVKFDWKFLTNESITSQWDFSFITLNSSAFALGDTNVDSGFLPSLSTEYDLETSGWRQYSLTIPTTGIYTLGFGVLQARDNQASSALLVDNVSFTAYVPEPSIILLLGFGLAGLAGVRRFKK
jgi:hypothetical protein